MFLRDIAEIEITKDKDRANKLLNDGWVFVELKQTLRTASFFCWGVLITRTGK